MFNRISQPDTLDGTEFNLAEINFRIPRIAAARYAKALTGIAPMTWEEALGETIFDVWDSAHERREFALFLERKAATTEEQFLADEDEIWERAQEMIEALPAHQRTLEVKLELIMDERDAIMKRNMHMDIAA